MKLAEWLREKNQDRLLLDIFDSKEVWEYLELGDTPEQRAAWVRKFPEERQKQMEKECERHLLAAIGIDTDGKVVWVAKGRDH